MSVNLARSALFVPAMRPDRFAKAVASGADVVIADLEDSVLSADKGTARDNLDRFFHDQPSARLVVRINALDSSEAEADLQLCARHAGIICVLLPKADAPELVRHAAGFGKPVWPIIESALAVANLASVAIVAGVARLAFGSLDFSLDLGLDPDSPAGVLMLDQARYGVLLNSRVAGLAPPLDGVFPHIDDLDGLQHSVARVRDMGFGGAMCIHPRQVSVINQVFAPSPEQLVWAERVIAAAATQGGAFQLDGKMVDAPVVKRAQRIREQVRQA